MHFHIQLCTLKPGFEILTVAHDRAITLVSRLKTACVYIYAYRDGSADLSRMLTES